MTFSAGVVSCGKKHRDWEDLVKEADGLLYRAKSNGKNQIVQADPKGITRENRFNFTESV